MPFFLQISTKLHFFGGKSASKVRKFGRKSVVWMIVRRQIKLAVVKKLAGQSARLIRLNLGLSASSKEFYVSNQFSNFRGAIFAIGSKSFVFRDTRIKSLAKAVAAICESRMGLGCPALLHLATTSA